MTRTRSKNCKKRQCNSKVIVLYNCDIPSTGYTITKSGRYCLGENIDWFPVDDAIAIKSTDINNIYLNLNKYSITQRNNAVNTMGINIVRSIGITITNGTTENMTGMGGIQIDYSDNISISNVIVRNTGVPDAYGGLQITESQNIRINNVNCNSNTGEGLHLTGVRNARIENSTFNDQRGGNLSKIFFPLPGQSAWGCGVSSSANPDGSLKTKTSNVWFENCSFNNNVATADAGGLEVGPWSLLPVSDITCINCETLNNEATGADTIFNDCSGFVLVHVDRFLFKDCIGSGQKHLSLPGNNSAYAVSGATGFSLNDSSNGTLLNCYAEDNTGIGNTSIGIRIRSCVNVVTKGCHASNNINNNPNGVAYGFYTDVDDLPNFPEFASIGKSYVFENCVSQGNKAPISGISGGFKIANLVDSVIRNCTGQENDVGILVTDSSSQFPPYVSLSKNNIFDSNTVQGNLQIGINDTTTVSISNNAYIKNVSRSNGALGNANYVGLPTGTPISIWDISSGIFPTTNTFTNLDIVP